MNKGYIEVDILDVMSVMEGSYPDANQRWDELKKLIELQRVAPQSNGHYVSTCKCEMCTASREETGTHKTMKNVKDRYFPNRSLDELEGKVSKT